MKKLTVLVDFDQTLNNLNDAWVDYLNNRHGTTVKPDDIRDWDMTKAFPALTSEQIYAPLKEEALWSNVVPLNKSYENVVKLREDGHRILVVTTSNPTTVPIKLNRVLFKYFPFFDYHDVIITSRKQLICGDVLVDDAPHNLTGDTIYKKILITASHNKEFNEESIGAVRCNDWDEIYEVINKMAEEELDE